jgi:hypothetical protein
MNIIRQLEDCGGMTKRDLIAALEEYDDDAFVVFQIGYGDYVNTQQALPIADVEAASINQLYESAYSNSRIAINEDEDCDEDSDQVIVLI